MARNAIVTAAASGIGRATCRALADAGIVVAVADINLEGARAVAASLPHHGHVAIHVDVTDEQSIARLFAEAEQALGPVGVIACVAGGTVNTHTHRPTIADTPLADWMATDALNARSTFLCIREFLRRRRAVPVADGRIITVASLAGQTASSPAGAAYSASKAAILALTRVAALEGGPMGITANTISPGSIDTPALRATVPEEQLAQVVRGTPVARLGQPEDIAAAIAFLVSPAASFITGSTIDVNGGRRMQ